ncbi:MAG TPA: hypothetical protein IAB60_01310 [Candidatus Caccovicinus merdipullorum]|uniref:Uncharacterized protein n=1 Tax=Candidatus Caccovicinus merdipullorum TaxID=2840724 RepID=A0A9D1GHQ4_9FIRM|nr:hypothetical protein [Candidatus Caccovicinus merdipullorum]
MKKKREKARKRKARVIMAAALTVLIWAVIQLIRYALGGVHYGVWIGDLCLNVLIYEVLLLVSGYILLLSMLSFYRQKKKSDLLYGEK